MQRAIAPAAAMALLAVCFGGGCASIVSGRRAQVKISSSPQQAYVSVRDHEGVEVASGQTPAVVSIPRGRTWLRPAHYTAVIAKPGYQTAQVPIRSTLNPWIFGNIALGGPIGLAVDGTTGAGWKPNPNEITQTLAPYGQEQLGPPPGLGVQQTSAQEPVVVAPLRTADKSKAVRR